MKGLCARAGKANVFIKIAICVLLAAVVNCFIFNCAIHVVDVCGVSAMPTYLDGDRVLVQLACYRVQRNDTVIIRHSGRMLIKRVVAVAGQSVEVSSDGLLVVDGETVLDGFEPIRDAGILASGAFTVPEGCIFVVGDNRNNSFDSRFFGAVDCRDIYARVLCKIELPFSALGAQ